MLPIGDALFGQVDQVPGHFYVATRFFHIGHLPLLPFRSYLVIEGTEIEPAFVGTGSYKGWAIGWDLRSILFGWLRGAALLGAFISGIAVIITLAQYYHEKKPDHLVAAGWATAGLVGAIGLIVLSRRMTVASRPRLVQLAARLDQRYLEAAQYVRNYLDATAENVLEQR